MCTADTRSLSDSWVSCNCWSRCYLRMAMMHSPTKFDADIFIQSRDKILTFSVIQYGGHRHLGFSSYVYYFKFCIDGSRWLSSVSTFLQITLVFPAIDGLLFLKFVGWHHANKLPVYMFGHCTPPTAVIYLPTTFGATIFIHCADNCDFTKFKMTAVCHLRFVGEPWEHSRRPICVA